MIPDKIRVQRSNEKWRFGDGQLTDHHWTVGSTPEEPRTTHWATWDKAMRWAPDVEYRANEVMTDVDGGW